LTNEPGASGTKVDSTRIIVDNLTEEQALQINGPVGEDMWRKVSHLEIKRNKASGNSTQLNYPVNMEVFKQVMAARGAGQEANNTNSMMLAIIGLVLALVLGLAANWAIF
jgi:hypothetical protein